MVRRLHQYTQSQKRFEALFAEGLSIFGTPSTYEAASEKFFQAVREAPLVWTKHRFYAFQIAMMAQKFYRSMDIDAITEDFIENENEPAHFRVLAAYYAAALYTEADFHMNVNTAAEFMRQRLDIIAASSLSEVDASRQVLYPPYQSFCMKNEDDGSPPSDLKLKTVLDFMEQKIRKQLTAWTTVEEEANPNQLRNEERTCLQQRALAGGKECDCCGKTPEELQIPSFSRCKRCAMVFYCSVECQRDHWKHKGHKQACREEGQIEIGDNMQFAISTESVACVEVISRIGEGGQWQVKYYGSEEVVTVNGADLMRLRPPSTL